MTTALKRPWKVLVVEDNPDHAWMLQRTLTGTGAFEIVAARSAREARTAVQAADGAFDAVVTDQRLPDAEGLHLIRELREGGYRGIVLLVTAHATDEVAAEGLDAGADDFVFKARGYPERVAEELAERLGEAA